MTDRPYEKVSDEALRIMAGEAYARRGLADKQIRDIIAEQMLRSLTEPLDD